MTRLLLIFSVFIWAACTSPVKVNNEIQVSNATLLYQADNYTSIKALSVSPKDGKIAFITSKPEFDLQSASSVNFKNRQTLAENLFDIQDAGKIYLSPKASKLIVLQSSGLILRDIATGIGRSFMFGGKSLLMGKWADDEQTFYLLAADSVKEQNQVLRLNLSDGSSPVVWSGTHKLKLFDLNGAQNSFCLYERSASGHHLIFVKPGRSAEETLTLNRSPQVLAFSHGGRQILWGEKNDTGMLEFYLHNLQTGQTQELLQIKEDVSAVRWSPDDAKILFLHSHGLSVYEFQSLKTEAVALSADSSGEVKFSPQWASDGARIYFIREKPVSRLNLFSSAQNNSFRSMRINGFEKYQMDWDGEGNHILINGGQSVIVKDLQSGTEDHMQLPLHSATPVHWGGPQGQWLTYVSDEGGEQQLILIHSQTGQLQKYSMKGIDSVSDIAWLHNFDYVSFIFPQKEFMLIYGLSADTDELQKVKTAPGDIQKVCWAPEDASLAELNGLYAAVQGRTALGIYYFNVNYIYWLSHLTPLNAAYFAWNHDGKSLIYVSAEETGPQQVFMEQVIYLND